MARANLKIKVGSYAGTGAYQSITDVGFMPDFLLIMAENSQHCVWKTRHIKNSNSVYFGSATADDTTSTMILGLFSNGFSVGTSTLVNQASINFHYIAFKGKANALSIGDYIGSGVDNKNVTDASKIAYTPYFVLIGGNAAVGRIYRCGGFHTGDSSILVGSGGNLANGIQNHIANGFQVGSGSTVNAASNIYHYFCLAELPKSCMKAGTYTGTGTEQTISGVGFKPDFLLIKANGTTSGSESAGLWTSTMPEGNARRVTGIGLATQRITGTHTDGFSVGTDNGFNETGFTFQYIAFKAGDHYPAITRTTT